MIKRAALLLLCACVLSALMLSGCASGNNAEIVGEWAPSTVSINGTTVSYSALDTKDRDFGFNFYSDGKCRVKIGGVENEGTFTFNETSVDVEYGGKTQKLSYNQGVLTLQLSYNDITTSYMFTKVTK